MFRFDTMIFFSLKQKDTPFSLSQFPKSTEQNSRSPKTMTLYSENNGKTCYKLVVCDSKLLFPNLATVTSIMELLFAPKSG